MYAGIRHSLGRTWEEARELTGVGCSAQTCTRVLVHSRAARSSSGVDPSAGLGSGRHGDFLSPAKQWETLRFLEVQV